MPETFISNARAMRRKRHTLLLLLDEFPLFGRLPHFEKQMGAMAGYGLKAFLVCQSPNHITRAYGRENTITDNCHLITAFAAADAESAKKISDMAGEVWELRSQTSEHRPHAFFGPRKGAITFREERRPLIGPGDVRKLPRDEQLIFVAGSKPIRAKKLKFDKEQIFLNRLRPAPRGRVVLTTTDDWSDVRPLGRLVKDASGAVRVESWDSPAASSAQGDLFAAPLSSSEQALAGLRAAHMAQSAPQSPPSSNPPNDPAPKRRRAARQIGV